MNVFLPIIGETTTDDSTVNTMLGADHGILYNSESKDFEIQNHAYDINSIGNLFVKLKTKGIDTIITIGMPLLAYSMCLEMGFKLYKAQNGSATYNLKLHEREQLEYFSAKDTKMEDDCMGACSSCSSNC